VAGIAFILVRDEPAPGRVVPAPPAATERIEVGVPEWSPPGDRTPFVPGAERELPFGVSGGGVVLGRLALGAGR
jgi:hypothetical protein